MELCNRKRSARIWGLVSRSALFTTTLQFFLMFEPVGAASNEQPRASELFQRVFYATDRALASEGDPTSFETYPDPMERTHQGIVFVERRHKALPRLMSIKALNRTTDSVVSHIADELGRTRTSNILLYIHGYNHPFDDASEDAVVIADATGFKGPVVVWSWPSTGETTGYMKDEDAALWTVPHLRDFLHELSSLGSKAKITIVAHSMGNRATCHAIARLSECVGHSEPTAKFSTLILIAPDIAPVLFGQYIPKLTTLVDGLVAYVSNSDLAIKTSAMLHGNNRNRMFAVDRSGRVLHPELEAVQAIDVSDCITWNPEDIHGYFRNNAAVIRDLTAVIHRVKNPETRNIACVSGNRWRLQQP